MTSERGIRSARLVHLGAVATCLMAGCASAPGARAVPFQAPSTSPESATLVVIQKGGALNMSYSVAMDTSYRFVGGLARNTWFETRVPPGHHDFYAVPMFLGLPKDGVCEGFSADLSPGQTYYVQLRVITKVRDCDPNEKNVGYTRAGQCEMSQGSGNIVNDDDYDPSLTAGMMDGEIRTFVGVLATREKVRMDPLAYLQRFQRLEPIVADGQAQLDERLNGYRCRAYSKPVAVTAGDFMK